MHPDDKQSLLHAKDFPKDRWKKMQHFRDYVIEFVKEHDFRTGAELGVRKGYLLFRLLDACPKLHMTGVDVWEVNKADRRPIHAGYEKLVRAEAKRFGNRVKLIKAFTNVGVKQIEDASLDFVFIDADHSYNNCKEDIILWSPKVKKDGWLMGDDIERTPGVKRAVEELLPKNELLSPNIWISPNTL